MPETQTHHYLIYFRRRRGGIGIPYKLARTEFTSLFSDDDLQITHEHIPKHRMWITLNLAPKDMQHNAQDLAYTEAILSQKIEPYRGQTIAPTERGRWHTGWVRRGDTQIYQEEVFVQNIANRRKESPDQHPFSILKNGQLIIAKGYHTRRALSAMDARFLFNIANLPQNTRILDPFAGFGGIIREAHRRNTTCFASDIDPTLSPGLSTLAPQKYTLADAQSLPHLSHTFDAIITEPPFHPKYQHAVYNALPELIRVIKPTGKLVLLVAQNMHQHIQAICHQHHLYYTHIATIPRDHGLRCPVLIIQSLTK